MEYLNQAALVQIVGVNGDTVTVSGPADYLDTIMLAESPQGLFSPAPMTGIWQQTAFQDGATYLGHRIEPLDATLTFDVFSDAGDYLTAESRLLSLFAPDEYATIVVSHMGETRELQVVLLDSPVVDNKKDPAIQGYSKITVSLRAPWPFWRGETTEISFNFSNVNQSVTKRIENRSDLPVWPRWLVTGGQAILPDYAWGKSVYGRSDDRRTVRLAPVPSGVDLVVDTYPRNLTYSASNGANFAGQMGGVDFVYAIPPGAAGNVTVTSGSPAPSRVLLELREWWQRPYGRIGGLGYGW